MTWDAIKTISSIASAAIALASFCWGLLLIRAKNRIGKELAEIRRRGDAPFLKPCDTAFDMLCAKVGVGEVTGWPAGNENLLCFIRDEVSTDLPDGYEVVLVLENAGATARTVQVRLDGEDIEFGREPDFDSCHGLQFVLYPYHREKHGKEQWLTVTFESDNGVQDTHRYMTRHGYRTLIRVDPPLPPFGIRFAQRHT